MYVIGRNTWDFLKTKQATMMKWKTCEFWNEIELVTYACDLNEATIFQDYETASKIKEEIIKRKDEILFENNNLIGELLDREKGNRFDVNDLKIYELVPQEIKER
jgi:hypothetical protein